MNTTESIYKHKESEKKEAADKKAEPAGKPGSIFKEEGVVRATNSPDPAPPPRKEPDYLSPVAAAQKEARDTQASQGSAAGAPVVGALPKGVAEPTEGQEERILRVLKTARARLQGRGMPELDIEVDELISELDKGGK